MTGGRPTSPLGRRLLESGRRVLGAGRASIEWTKLHRVEIILAIVFAAPFAWLAARLLEPPSHEAYKIHILESSMTNRDTRQAFERLASEFPKQAPNVGDVPVEILPSILPNDEVATVIERARELAARKDTLMVVGHLPSGLTEAVLPIFLGARPQVPYLSTSASDDDLLAKCKVQSVAIGGFVPLIQPSPRNSDEGAAAVRYAVQHHRSRFLLVTEQTREKDPYATSLQEAWEKEIYQLGGMIVGRHAMGPPPTDDQLAAWDPDCVLYAGSAGIAHTLMNALARSRSLAESLMGSNATLLAIFADSVIESRDTDEKLRSLYQAGTAILVNGRPMTDLRFTYASNADDYNQHDNEYARDAVMIAEQLIADLRERGGDFPQRVRSLFHLESVRDARRNLIRIMRENAHNRSWYTCVSGKCVFAQFKGQEGMFHARRENGMFHVWEFTDGLVAVMRDVDGWHPPKDRDVADGGLQGSNP